MAGISGWINTPVAPEQAARLLGDMLGAAHQPIVLDGSAIAARGGVVPVSTHQAGTLIVAVEGYVEWRSPDLAALGARESCAAVVAEAYRRHGRECLQSMGGPFAVVLVDAASGSGLLAVDRLGIRTMCYANPPGQLIFGSSAENVAAHPGAGRALSAQAMFNYLYCHVVPSPGTIYHGIEKLQPGECVVFRQGAVDRRFYWRLRYADDGKEPFDSLQPRFHRLLRDAARRAGGGDAELGAFLSGGTDSSTVAGLLTELRGKPVRTYSIGFAAQGFDEMEYARATARHFGTSAREYYVTPQDVVEAIPLIAQAYDEPFGNASAVPTYFCARMACADGVKVMLAGDGGDEIFGGNARYAKQMLFEGYRALPAALRRALIEPIALRFPGAERIAPLRKLKSYVRQACIPLPERLESYNFLHRSPLNEIFEAGFLSQVDPGQPLALLREAYKRTASTSPVNCMMHLDLKFTLADNDLRKVSRMAELAGVEVRYPLLDEALVEFAAEVPASMKVKGLKLRYFFKRALKDFLPPETIAKTKHGFGLPIGLWLKDYAPLRALARDSLAAFQRRGIVKASYIDELLRQHELGHATYFGVMIWVIVMLERWLAARNL